MFEQNWINSTGSWAICWTNTVLFNYAPVSEPAQNQVALLQGLFPYLGEGDKNPLLLGMMVAVQGVLDAAAAIFGARAAPLSWQFRI